MFEEGISLKLFYYYINPYLGQLLANELTMLKVHGFNLHLTEDRFNEHKSKWI
jgi:hypothetical protein